MAQHARRTFVKHVIAASALAGIHLLAAAQSYPDKPITMVVPFPPGGTTDILARTIAARMSVDLQQQVIIDNRQGAGGNSGAELVANAKPDGYTVLFSTAGPLSINQFLYSKQGYDPVRDFAPVSYVASVPIMLVSNPQRPFKTVAELIAYAKANPGKLSYGSQGNGTTSHLTMELFKRQAGIDILHIPYKGSSQASTDLMGGQVDLMFDNSPSTWPFVQSGKMHGLGVATAQRVPSLGNLPAIAETIKGFESTAWFGVVAPAKTPPAVIDKLNKSIDLALTDAGVKEKFASSGVTIVGGAPDALRKQVASESAKWSDVIKKANISLD